MQSLIVLVFLVFDLAKRVKISESPSPEIRASLENLYFWDPRRKGYQPSEFRLI